MGYRDHVCYDLRTQSQSPLSSHAKQVAQGMSVAVPKQDVSASLLADDLLGEMVGNWIR